MEMISFNINTLISLIDWRIFFDVPLLALIIFIFYRTLRSSGAWSIVIGIFFAIIVYIVARIFNFSGIIWLFSNVSNIALIALIIIFQPEIRKIFEKAATTLRMNGMVREEENPANLIVDAVYELAEKKWGAIIVLPGRESLRSWISGGVRVNSDISETILVSIFDPHSPGHDGAVVIENGRVMDMGLRLPLSQSEKLGSFFGTRHHAALGLSEKSDSFVIVVSEERRKVSYFLDGEYFRVTDRDDLVVKINEFWKKMSTFAHMPSTYKKGVLALEVTFSLALAFMLWASVTFTTTKVKEMNVTVPVEYIVPSKGDMVIVGDKPGAVRVKITGTSSALALVNPRELKATVDLAEAKAGTHNISISSDLLDLPGNVNIVEASPSEFEVLLQSYQEREVIIKPQIIGTLPDGLELESIEISPEKINVLYASDGTKDEEVYLATTPIYLQNITENTKLLCNLIVPPGIMSVAKQWPDVVVSIKLKKK